MTDLWRRLGQEGSLTPELRKMIGRIYGDRGRRAIAAADECRVKKYLDFYVVVGRTDEYIVEEDFCTCSDFTFRGKECWHILAVKIARLTGRYEEYPLWYQDGWTTEG
jgi:predicted nucleic acid-binding Zn finger protein